MAPPSSASVSSTRAFHSQPNPKSQLDHLPVPDDIGLHIASFLEAPDLCSLGSCSRHLRGLCNTDFLWASLFKRRWPSVDLEYLGPVDKHVVEDAHVDSWCSSPTGLGSLAFVQGWKRMYALQLRKVCAGVCLVIKFVNDCSKEGSLEVGDFLKAIEELSGMNLGFEDVKMFLFRAKRSVMVNLVGVQYAMSKLGVAGDVVREAAAQKRVCDRKVCVFSFRVGRWFFGFRLPDEHTSQVVSIGDMTASEWSDLRSTLDRGAVHGVLRVHITPVSDEEKTTNTTAAAAAAATAVAIAV